ncbi:ester cyclase [Caballeronia sp. DA-9]|uniref:ester cyclase n=1 Tax=Caballeronia sp. DA-9 TaxID=3436237 RepID=UPI003F66E016
MKRRLLISATPLAISMAFFPVKALESQTDGRSVADRFATSLTAHDISAFSALFSTGYRNHQISAASPALAVGVTAKEATVRLFADRLAGMPDLAVEVEAVVSFTDKVAASFVYTGSHLGVYLGVAPTGRRLRFTSCDIFSIREQLIVEHWGMGDIAGIQAQLHIGRD